ncbi:IMV heparin binding surface protein [Choristoneura biennis entomopoxvirus]|uniref:IMV heparin binding surface protein n=1 Tax=Choristoneura biennis entomopoxvirus TaxID=10288 RepID=A0A916KPW7_CBEPV|nr:IMV heparin binding surface protein [Choristoneura biennis entomopoxvirus]CCU55853.1 IMV heparin binding surface protein [Choristoneura biennis entomopoxvirus]
MENYHIIILTIKRNSHRIEKLENILSCQNLTYNKDYSIFYGIDYKNIDRTNLINICKRGFKKTCPYSTLACASSHILLWKYISTLKNKYNYIIVLEDDTYINISEYNNHIITVEDLLKKNDSIVFLYSDCYLMGTNIRVDNNDAKITHNPKFHVSMGCYCITPKIAKKLYYFYIKSRIWFHIDFQLNFDIHNISLNRYIYIAANVCNQYEGNKSSMGLKHSNVMLIPIENTKLMRIISTPILRIRQTELDFYIIIMLISLIVSLYFFGLNISALIFLFFIIVDIADNAKNQQ